MDYECLWEPGGFHTPDRRDHMIDMGVCGMCVCVLVWYVCACVLVQSMYLQVKVY